MARFVDLEEDEDVGAGPGGFTVNDPRAASAPHHEVVPPIPPPGPLHHDDPQQSELSQKDQHLHLLRKLQLLSASSRNGPWPHSLYNPEPLGTMDSSTFQAPITNAFQCYPVVEAIAASIDLNTLDALSRTCRLIHHGLIQYRTTLINSTLHCQNEEVPVDGSETFRYRARAGNWFYMEDGRSYNGKSGDCARDMVGECRRCGDVICRNCAIKPPASVALKERHRRLCKPCVHAPIATLIKAPVDSDVPLSSELVSRDVCKCADEGVWLCQPCGRSIRAADHDYQRIWRWRNQYGEVLGGLGTGIGEGVRGVVCGREADCCAAKEVEHQIEGIGGVVKRKRVRMVRVGHCVPEWDDERTSGSRILGREVRGERRSWCGWCNRVIPGEKDLFNEPPSSSSSSAGGSRRTSTSTTRSTEMNLD
ncbi:uncharacterized protein Y057_8692 [Fusarium fujikuroi]|nr:uncharacterized protein Y057_8692 [Fusarium fujikuroi]